MTIPNLLTVKQLNEKHRAFAIGGIRDRIFHADKNGLAASGALVYYGRRVLIDETKWFGWLEAQNGGSQ